MQPILPKPDRIEAKRPSPTARPSIACEPREDDVLFGRGPVHQHHPGNRRMQLLLDNHREEYDKADRFDKTVIARTIIQMIESKRGRFLKFEKNRNIWEEVPDKMARDKVSHAMRDNRKKPLVATAGIKKDEIRETAAEMFLRKLVPSLPSPQLIERDFVPVTKPVAKKSKTKFSSSLPSPQLVEHDFVPVSKKVITEFSEIIK
jgi:hypothetical protein